MERCCNHQVVVVVVGDDNDDVAMLPKISLHVCETRGSALSLQSFRKRPRGKVLCSLARTRNSIHDLTDWSCTIAYMKSVTICSADSERWSVLYGMPNASCP